MRKKVLIIDDDENIRTLVKKLLDINGFVVSGAKSALEAKPRIRDSKKDPKNRFDLILLDINLGNTSGLELLNELKAENLIVSPIIIITGEADMEKIKKASAGGAVGFLLKPFTIEALLEKINKVLSEQKSA